MKLLSHVLHGGPKSLDAFVAWGYTCASATCFSTTSHGRARKKVSQYSVVDTEKYSSLFKSVVSFRVSSQTPTSLHEEDGLLYGPIVNSKPTSDSVRKVPRNPYPLINCAKMLDLTLDGERRPPTRIALQRDSGKHTSPSVTRILQETMSPEQMFYLERWRRKMIAELGEEGFKKYTLNLFRQGKLFHSVLEDILAPQEAKEDTETSEEVGGYIESVRHVLDEVHGVKAIESMVQHQSLNYLGLVDCVAMYRGKLCVIDWKTSEKPKPYINNTYDNPLQVAAYIGAINADDNYNYQVESGMIVVAYKDGSPAHCHLMGFDLCQEYWCKWLVRLEEYVEKRADKNGSEKK